MTSDLPHPSVSCILPCFNGADYLAEALESLAGQTLKPYEIIVVDDGSTDNSCDIAKGLGIDGLKVIHQENQGATKARLTGLRVAQGEFLSFLDADDLAPVDRLERLVGVLLDKPNVEAAFGWWENFWIDGLAHEAALAASEGRAGIQRSIFLPSAVLRRTAFSRFGTFVEHDSPEEARSDKELVRWVVRAKLAGMVCHTLPQITLRRRIHRNNMSRTQDADVLFQLFKDIRGMMNR